MGWVFEAFQTEGLETHRVLSVQVRPSINQHLCSCASLFLHCPVQRRVAVLCAHADMFEMSTKDHP